tara:strand:- start:175 stop:669 length:495 start_codon:yes stop_codon:yes gene_type:complete
MKYSAYLLILILFLNACAFKPLYKDSNLFDPYHVKIVVKTKEPYENTASNMKLYLNQKINKKNLKKSNLKLIVSVSRDVINMGINKDLNSYSKMVIVKVMFSLYDKKGELTKGSLKNSSSFNLTTNNYANILSLEDSSNKLVKALSDDISSLILSSSFGRKVTP